MPLPKFNKIESLELTPLYENLFEVEASLPDSFLENIVEYDLDTYHKKVTFKVNINQENLKDMQYLSTESIKIKIHDINGKVIILNELEDITNPSVLSLRGRYYSDSLLIGTFVFNFGTLYQKII